MGSNREQAAKAYSSQRNVGETLYELDSAAPLITACINGDEDQVEQMLQSTTVAFEAPRRIYTDLDGLTGKGDDRKVIARPILNLAFMVESSASHGQAAVTKQLLDFGQQHSVPIDELINSESIDAAIRNGSPAVLDVLLTVMPEAANLGWGHGLTALGEAAARNNAELVALLLRHGADPNERGYPRWF